MPFETRTRRWEAVNGCLLVTGFFNRGACNGPEKRRARFQWSVAPRSWVHECHVLGVRIPGESLRIRQPVFGCAMATREKILGVGVSAINMDDAVEIISSWIDKGERQYVCVTGVHGIMESRRSEQIRQIHNAAGLVTPDGMPLVWLLRSAGFKQVRRVYGPDLMLAIFAAGETKGYRHVFYGATESTLAVLRKSFDQRFPRAHIVGSIAPAFRPLSRAEDEAHVSRINQASPDIVWIGLGTPKQEQWMADHRGRLTASVLIGVGAAFDMHAGVVPQAPPFVQKIGLEWAFRLYTEPRRLWRRYLRNNPQFIADIVAQKTGLRRFDDTAISRKPSDGRR